MFDDFSSFEKKIFLILFRSLKQVSGALV